MPTVRRRYVPLKEVDIYLSMSVRRYLTLRMHDIVLPPKSITTTGNDWYRCKNTVHGVCRASLCIRCKLHLDTTEAHYDAHTDSSLMVEARMRAAAASGRDSRKTRTSNRSTADATNKKAKKTYKADAQGCEHDNPDVWQLADREYANPRWRRNNSCCISLRCSNCNEVV
jgi:hypothetical protein